MELFIDEQTKSWLQDKGKPVAVKTLRVTACCAPPIQELTTYFSKPKDIHNYEELHIDNCFIYIEKPLMLDGKITLKLTGISIFKTISATLK
ncbi:MAG: CC/Se motif family (seleno)protein [Lysinibacillus sp.]